jgi:hypothetical protein
MSDPKLSGFRLTNTRQHSLGFMNGRELAAGASVEIDRAEAAALLADATFKSWCELGWCGLTEVAPPPENAPEPAPASLPGGDVDPPRPSEPPAGMRRK